MDTNTSLERSQQSFNTACLISFHRELLLASRRTLKECADDPLTSMCPFVVTETNAENAMSPGCTKIIWLSHDQCYAQFTQLGVALLH